MEFFEQPNFLNVAQFRFHNAGIHQPVREQGLGLFEARTVNDAILVRVKSGAQLLEQGRMFSEHQQGFHGVSILPGDGRKKSKLRLAAITAPRSSIPSDFWST